MQESILKVHNVYRYKCDYGFQISKEHQNTLTKNASHNFMVLFNEWWLAYCMVIKEAASASEFTFFLMENNTCALNAHVIFSVVKRVCPTGGLNSRVNWTWQG